MRIVAQIDHRLYELKELDVSAWARVKHSAVRGIPAYHHTDKDGLHIWPNPDPAIECLIFRLEVQPHVVVIA